MTKNEDLDSFRISDVRRPQVRGGTRAKEAEPVEEEATVGFPQIEAVLEAKSIQDVAEALRVSYGQLETLASSPDLRKKTAAKKAMAAYERVADLLEYLFETKASLQEGSD